MACTRIILLRSLVHQQGVEQFKESQHIALQIDPGDRMIEPEMAQRYLERYFSQGANITIFWGSLDEFLGKLMDAWTRTHP
jgi:hypothetical protein